jgi:RHS repeat-associated protein
VTWTLGADAFGETAPNANPDGDAVSLSFNLRMPGQVFDVETGYHYNTFRDYEPGTGRYSQSDPIGLAGGVSTYGYVGGSPLGYIDPQGLEPRLYALPLHGRRPVRGAGGRRPLSTADRRLFDEAVSLARRKFSDCECSCPDAGRGYCFREEDKLAILEAFEQTDFYYYGNWSPNSGSGERYEPHGALLYRGAFTHGVEWLAATLIHESVHRSEGTFWDEPTAYLIDDRCFGFQHYGAP